LYNGELTYSRIIKSEKYIKEPVAVEDRYLRNSGRRLDTMLEKPFIVCPLNQNKDGSMRDTSTASISLQDRWDQIGKLLLEEAGKWGKCDEKPSVMAAYLEELSRLTIPESLSKLDGGASHRAGIIDVVLSLGTSVTTSVSGLREPQRKLHQNTCGLEKKLVVVPVPPPRNRRTQNSQQSLEFPRSQTMAQLLQNSPARTFGNTGIRLSSSPPKLPATFHQLNERSETDHIPPPKLGQSVTMPHLNSVMKVHPNRPKNIPQKTFKGYDEPEKIQDMKQSPTPQDDVESGPRRSSRIRSADAGAGEISVLSTQTNQRQRRGSQTSDQVLLQSSSRVNLRAENVVHAVATHGGGITADHTGETAESERPSDCHVSRVISEQVQIKNPSQPRGFEKRRRDSMFFVGGGVHKDSGCITGKWVYKLSQL
jgi:hypothetical protein